MRYLSVSVMAGFALLVSGGFILPLAAEAQKVTMRVGHVASEDNPYHLGSVYFGEKLKELTNGEIEVKVFPNSQLGNERDMAELLQFGSLQMAVIANAVLSRYSTRPMVLDFPFIFRDNTHFDKVVDGPVGKELASIFPPLGLRILAYWEAGWRHPFTKTKCLASPADMKGLKFRVMESQLHIALYNRLGARAVPLAAGEVYTALQQGLVDGSDNPLVFYEQLKYHEQGKYLSPIPFFKTVAQLVIGEKFFQSLSEPHRTAVIKAGEMSARYEREKFREIEAGVVERLKKQGVQFCSPNPAPFIEAIKPVWREFADKVGGMEVIEMVERTR